ncbi:hypothetical protein CLIB1423_06S06964 [[Candida] railenensis]|uniref:Uncharacterized protein n=1 Tax=[Candida] railenensis TaxID=45579 RepID=A0A9P0VY20_9ASCO|nr:hypothetical protein CLIB1423_06S06964 [[Candida] railenensis]
MSHYFPCNPLLSALLLSCTIYTFAPSVWIVASRACIQDQSLALLFIFSLLLYYAYICTLSSCSKLYAMISIVKSLKISADLGHSLGGFSSFLNPSRFRLYSKCLFVSVTPCRPSGLPFVFDGA